MMRSLAMKSVGSCASCSLGRVSRPSCPFHETRTAAGTLLLGQGEIPTQLWFVRLGTVLMTSASAAGDETFCALRGAGSLIGLEVLRGEQSVAAAWALTDLVVCGLDAGLFGDWIGGRDSPLGAVLDLTLVEVAARARERIALAGRTSCRVARFLLERWRRDPDAPPLVVEHQLLARMLGMRPETLSRALARLRTARAIEGPELGIIDAARLAKLAGD